MIKGKSSCPKANHPSQSVGTNPGFCFFTSIFVTVGLGATGTTNSYFCFTSSIGAKARMIPHPPSRFVEDASSWSAAAAPSTRRTPLRVHRTTHAYHIFPWCHRSCPQGSSTSRCQLRAQHRLHHVAKHEVWGDRTPPPPDEELIEK